MEAQRSQFIQGLRSGHRGNTIRATVGRFKNKSSELKQLLSHLSAIHLETPISSMKTNYNNLQIDLSSEGRRFSKWFPSQVFDFIMSHSPPAQWFRSFTPLDVEDLPTTDLEMFDSDDEPPMNLTVRPDKDISTMTIGMPRLERFVTTETVTSTPKPAFSASVKVMLPRRLRKFKSKGLSSGDIKRLARRGGVKRISKSIYADVQASLYEFVKDIVNAAAVYTEHAKRKTVTTTDVCMALKSRNVTLYMT
ncbi:MAG: histone H4 [Cetobacterium sp.]|uniref:histone H4 n=1 Tax=Cetobacterium sp. TaxID=2071632 RepID=UPI003F3F6053